MEIQVNLLDAVAVVSTLALWAWGLSFERTGDWDFVTPLIGLAICVAPVLGWGAFYLGRWAAR
jgi:hypothetical protein